MKGHQPTAEREEKSGGWVTTGVSTDGFGYHQRSRPQDKTSPLETDDNFLYLCVFVLLVPVYLDRVSGVSGTFWTFSRWSLSAGEELRMKLYCLCNKTNQTLD